MTERLLHCEKMLAEAQQNLQDIRDERVFNDYNAEQDYRLRRTRAKRDVEYWSTELAIEKERLS